MEIFVRRPVLSIVLALVVVLGGLYAIARVPIVQFPVLESSAIEVKTHFTGASAEVVQGFITDPIEKATNAIEGLDFVDSSTVAGQSTVTAWLKLGEDSSTALAQLSAELNKVRSELPLGADDPAVSVKRADRVAGAFYLSASSEFWARHEVTDYLDRNVVPILSSIDGVQRVGLDGGRQPALRIWLNLSRLAAVNMSVDEVLNALQNNNLVAAVGNLEGTHQKLNILTNASLQTVEDFQELVLRDLDGYQLKLSDIARVEMGEDTAPVDARDGRNKLVFLSIWPLPGANEIAIGNELYLLLDEINAGLPTGLEIEIVYDSTEYMRAALTEIFKTLAETVVLVGAVILFMMGSVRVAIVPLVAIPLSILGAMIGMFAMGFTLNLLTILAIVLSVGLVVDDAIVVVENVARYKREGKSGIEAALLSSRVLFKPIVAMTFTLAAVFIPIGFTAGLSGALFREFAFTMATAIVLSGVVAVTLSPLMSAYLTGDKGHEAWLTRKVNNAFDTLARAYGALLRRLLNWRAQILVFSLVFSLLVVPFYLFSAKELAPVEDQGMISVVIQAAPGSSLDATNAGMDKLVDLGLSLPGSESFWQIVTKEGGFGGIEFKDFFEREQNIKDILPQLYGALAQLSELKVLPFLGAALPTAGQFDVEMVVKGPGTYQEMQGLAYAFLGVGFESGKFLYVDTDLKTDLPVVKLDYNHQMLADLGLTSRSVTAQLSALLSDRYVNRFDAGGRAYQVIPMAEEKFRAEPAALSELGIRLSDGTIVPLSTLADIRVVAQPRALGKFDQQRAFRVTGGVVPGTTKAEALAVLEKAADAILPPGYTIDYAGVSRQIKQEANSLLATMAMSLAIVYLALVVQFNSFRSPLIILLGSVPLALSGAVMISFLGFTSINIYSQIGIITLVGLVAKNGILITEFANQLMDQGKDSVTAIIEGAQSRLQAILMTTIATIIGHIPLLLVEGPGAEARGSIGIIIVAGMSIGTLFTLIALPSIFLLFTPRDTAKSTTSMNKPPNSKLELAAE
ncbi:efflux RND transporter permease subunit [Roseibium sp. RKSG952]|uniref:efflux RND transporter permease subunit n=1 Tax=Roseibium sp. RKSG952 TaxID=2529384 RepID=UPI0012BD493A|nr:efflux RND transporter permease subunit [Roseibium sp. RKSG952]MTI02991.1 efflux RND transporter permease subunit [Roseibium sp. RKSG952]